MPRISSAARPRKSASTAGKRDPYWARQFSCATRRVAFAASSVGLFSSPRMISASIVSESKKHPPLFGDVPPMNEALCRAAGTRRRYGFGGQGPFGVRTRHRRIGALEIGSDSAPCKRKANDDCQCSAFHVQSRHSCYSGACALLPAGPGELAIPENMKIFPLKGAS